MVNGVAEAFGIQPLLRNLGWGYGVSLFSDSSAARAIAKRRGNGKVRPLETRYLCIQDAVQSRMLEIAKVKGNVNPANALTKYTPAKEIREAHNSVVIRLSCDREEL